MLLAVWKMKENVFKDTQHMNCEELFDYINRKTEKVISTLKKKEKVQLFLDFPFLIIFLLKAITIVGISHDYEVKAVQYPFFYKKSVCEIAPGYTVISDDTIRNM